MQTCSHAQSPHNVTVFATPTKDKVNVNDQSFYPAFLLSLVACIASLWGVEQYHYTVCIDIHR